MHYTSFYKTPVGNILIASDEKMLTGVWIEGQKYFAQSLDKNSIEQETQIIKETKYWLDIYFSGKEPDFSLPIQMEGTPFQIEVWNILQTIPYGETITYKDIAQKIAKKRNITKMSAQAVGGAVSRNKISILIPCHRVVGTNNSLTGYAAGIEKKIKLLQLENINTKLKL